MIGIGTLAMDLINLFEVLAPALMADPFLSKAPRPALAQAA